MGLEKRVSIDSVLITSCGNAEVIVSTRIVEDGNTISNIARRDTYSTSDPLPVDVEDFLRAKLSGHALDLQPVITG